MKTEKCFPFFFDWLEPLSQLDGEEFKKLCLAMIRYYAYDKRPPKFEGLTKTIAMFIFSQIDRSKKNKENGKKGGNPKIKRTKNGSTDGSNTTTSTTTPTTTSTSTSTITPTPTPTNTSYVTNTNEERFGIFWEKYPRRMNRSNAFFEFIKLNLSDCEFEEMLSSLEKHKHSIQWRDSQYIPLPENYLKNRKWTDELEADNSTFDTDDMFEQALIRSRKIFEEGAKKHLAN